MRGERNRIYVYTGVFLTDRQKKRRTPYGEIHSIRRARFDDTPCFSGRSLCLFIHKADAVYYRPAFDPYDEDHAVP